MNLFRFSQLLFFKIRLNLKSESSKSYLSYFWWVIEPTLFVSVMYVVFGVFLDRGGEGFVAFLVCGNVPFLWFSKSISNATHSISHGRGLISQVRINAIFFPLVVIGQDLVKQLVVFFLLLIFLCLIGNTPTIYWFNLLPIMLVELVFIMGCALFVAAVVPFFPDFKYLVTTGLTLIMFGSGIFYSYEEVLLDEHKGIFLLNPMANIINNFRSVLLDNTLPNYYDLLWILISFTFVSIVLMCFFLRRSGVYARLVIE